MRNDPKSRLPGVTREKSSNEKVNNIKLQQKQKISLPDEIVWKIARNFTGDMLNNKNSLKSRKRHI